MKAVGQRLNRSRSWRRGSSPEQSNEAALRSATSVFRLILHFSFCIASLVLGFRLSRESLLVVVHLRGSEAYLNRASTLPSANSDISDIFSKVNNTGLALSQVPFPAGDGKPDGLYHEDGVKSSRVHVGRHGILIRPWPHPDAVETIKAYSLITRVQQEQRKLYGFTARRKNVIVITPTYRRTFQAIHLSSLMHTLMLVPGQLSWIIVEAGGKSPETASIFSNSGLNIHHLHLPQPMPADWPERHQMETLLRLRGLRFVRERQLEGVVVFADESNSHRLELFDEAQNVNWVGTLSVGLLMPPHTTEKGSQLRWNTDTNTEGISPFLYVQGPACNESGSLIGWHSETESLPSDGETSKPWSSLEWAGFVLNSAVVRDGAERPSWIRDWDKWVLEDGSPVSPTAVVTDETHIEPLGNCGRDVFVWWARVEARADSKYPERWVTDPQLEIVVPARHSSWSDPLLPPVDRPVAPEPKRSAEEVHDKKRTSKQARNRNQATKNSKKQDARGKPESV